MKKILKLVGIFLVVFMNTLLFNTELKAATLNTLKVNYMTYYNTGFSPGIQPASHLIGQGPNTSTVGLVGTENGANITEATVIIRSASTGYTSTAQISTTTGFAEFTDIPDANDVLIQVIAPSKYPSLYGIDPSTSQNPYYISLRNGETKTYTWREHAGGVLGRLVDQNSNPVSGATVTVTDLVTNATYTAISDINGEYFVLGVGAGTIKIEAYDPIYGVNVIKDSIVKNKGAQGPLGTSASVLNAWNGSYPMTVQPGSISGTVKDQDGNIIVNAQVDIAGIGIVNTDQNGYYNFPNVPVGTYTPTGSATGYSNGTGNTVTVTPSNNSVSNIVLIEKPGSLSGFLKDKNTTAVLTPPTVAGVISLKDASGNVVTTTVNSLGKYEFLNLKAGTYTVYSHGNVNYNDSQDYTVIINKGSGTTQNVEIEPKPGSISGNVKDASTNLPISGVVVIVKDTAGTQIGTGTTDSQGNYTVSNIKPGSVNVSLSPVTGYNTTQTLTPIVYSNRNTPNVNFALTREKGSLEGVVTEVGTVIKIPGVIVEVKDLSGVVIGTGTTNANGEYKISNIPTGFYTVSVKQVPTDYIIPAAKTNVEIKVNQVTKEDFQLDKQKGSLQGKVTDKNTGLPIQGATVKVFDPSNMGTPLYTLTTDSAGKYSVLSINVGTYTVTAEKTDYSTDSGNVKIDAGRVTNKDFQLEKDKGDLKGTVFETGTQNIIPNAKVTITNGVATYTVYTDSQGKYEQKNIPVGNWTVTGEKVNYTMDIVQGVQIILGQSTTQNLELTPHVGELKGKVTNIDTNSPVPNARIEVIDSTGNVVAFTNTIANGTYAFTGLRVGNYSVKFSHVDYYSQTATNVRINNGQVTIKNFFVRELSGKLTGVVYDARTNLPIEGATVYISKGNLSYSAVTNNKGEYEFLVSEGTYNTYAYKFGYTVDVKNGIIVKKSAVTKQDYYIENNTGTLIGTVIDKNTGAVVPNTTVTIKDLGGAIIDTTISDANGKYQFTNLPENKYALEASKTGYTVDPIPNVSIKEKTTTTQDIYVSKDDTEIEDGSILGKVIDEDTKLPIPGSVVKLIDSQGNLISTTTTNNNGDYAFNNVHPGNYEVEASKIGYITKAEYPVVAISGIDIVQNFELKKITGTKGNIEGTVSDKNTKDKITGAIVTLIDQSTDTVLDIAITDSNGYYEFKNLEAKDYTVSVTAQNYTKGASDIVTVIAGTTVEKNFELEKDDKPVESKESEISGTVIDAKTGLGISGAKVTIEKDGINIIVLTDANGKYSVTVSKGTYNVNAEAEGYNKSSIVTKIVPEGTKVVQDFALTKIPVDPNQDGKGNIIGYVKDKETGLPINKATVIIYDEKGNIVTEIKTDENGKYVLDNISEGKYVIKATKEKYNTETCTILVVKNSDTKVEDILLSKVKEEGNNNSNNNNNSKDNNNIKEAAKKLPQTGGRAFEIILILGIVLINTGVIIKKKAL